MQNKSLFRQVTTTENLLYFVFRFFRCPFFKTAQYETHNVVLLKKTVIE